MLMSWVSQYIAFQPMGHRHRIGSPKMSPWRDWMGQMKK